MDKICKHCEYKRFTCPIFKCDPYKVARRKRSSRWFNENFPIEDFDGEDRYIAGQILFFTALVIIGVFMIMSAIKVIGEWVE